MVPNQMAATSSYGAPASVNIPTAEQLTLQQEVGQLLLQMERASNTLDILFSVAQPPTDPSADARVLPTLASGIHQARSRMDELADRLVGLQRVIGAV